MDALMYRSEPKIIRALLTAIFVVIVTSAYSVVMMIGLDSACVLVGLFLLVLSGEYPHSLRERLANSVGSQTPGHALHKRAVLIPAVELVGLEWAQVGSTRTGPHDLTKHFL